MFETCKRLVLKVGSALMIDTTGAVRGEWLGTLAQDIQSLMSSGTQVIVVTSGAVALGRGVLGYSDRPLELEEKQAAAACGQIALVGAWHAALAPHRIPVAQLLLTADDSIHRRRYLNARNTLETLLERGVVPVINENDTVATAEIRFGDNDRLAARVAQMAGADVLVLFSDIDGLYTANPHTTPDAIFIPQVREITPDIEAMAGGVSSSVGSGGMITKIAAAKIAMNSGCDMVIARGTLPHPLQALREGGRSTRFIAQGTPLSARKHWIAGSLHPAGSISIDAGAVTALKSGKSLLPAGVTHVEGAFDRGDAVLIKDTNGMIIGKGLIAYAAEDAVRIAGKQSVDIEKILGFKRRDVLIHRDDMVLE